MHNNGTYIDTTTTTTSAEDICTIAIDDKSVNFLRANIAAVKSDGTKRACYEVSVCVYRTAGGAAIIEGSETKVVISESDATWNCTWAISGNNAILKANGNTAIAETVKWKGSVEIVKISE